jgi:6-phosphogluconolactonase
MTQPPQASFEVLPDAGHLARRVAEWLLTEATAKQGAFAIALSGGSTPRQLYRCLAEPPCLGAFPWQRTHWFWSDERFVPHDDERSNYRMAKDALLSRVPVPPGNIHPMPTEGVAPKNAAADYARSLASFYGSEHLDSSRPLFDVTLLGLGPDGHTASLFPGSPALDERAAWIAAVTGPGAEPRLTLTLPALNSARHAVFLVAGEEKRAMVRRLRAGDATVPAAHVRPVGALHIFCDADAAGPADRASL